MPRSERSLNKTERLFALVLLLQNRPSLTSADLAEHFGVSRRTIFRDLRALSESGVPLTYAEGGGYEILEGYQLPPLMLSAREAATLLVGTEFTKLQPEHSLRADADAVAMKIRSVLPQPVREYIDRLQEGTVLSPYHEVQGRSGATGEEEGRWFQLSEALAKKRIVRMTYYTPSRDAETERDVNPLGLVYFSDHWNLIAHDHYREEVRNFRLDRIRKMRVRYATFESPEDFDLREFLRTQGESPCVERTRVWFAHRAWRWARAQVPADIEHIERDDEGVTVTFSFDNVGYIARWLLRFGTDARAIDPPELEESLVETAGAVVGQYSSQVDHAGVGSDAA